MFNSYFSLCIAISLATGTNGTPVDVVAPSRDLRGVAGERQQQHSQILHSYTRFISSKLSQRQAKAFGQTLNASFAETQRSAVVKKYEQTVNLPAPNSTLLDLNATVSMYNATLDTILSPKRGGIVMPLLNDRDFAYYGNMTFGTPPQPACLSIDTGSSDTWVISLQDDPDKTEYDWWKSKTYRDSPHKPAELYYGSGDVYGDFVTDSVGVARPANVTDTVRIVNTASSSTATVVRSQVFASIRKQHGSFESTPCEGLLGLAWATIAKSGKATFFDNVWQQGLIKHEIFSVYLTDHGETGSEICFGCFDSTRTIVPTMTSWIPLIAQAYWTVRLDSISINGGREVPLKVQAAVDTGTSWIYIPNGLVPSFYAQIPGARDAADIYGTGFWSYPCNASINKISLTFAGVSLDFNPDRFNLGRMYEGATECVGAVVGIETDEDFDMAIIGVAFLTSYYTTYDQGRSMVGFTRSRNLWGVHI